MTCEPFRLALSARLDGEDPGMPAPQLDAHLAGCAPCRRFAAAAGELHRAARVRPAAGVPDLTAAVLAAVGDERRRRGDARRTALRLGLVAVGLVQLLAALPALLLGEDAGLPVHAARHIGSFDAAVAVGFLVAAWRPARVAGLLPVLAVLTGFLLLGAAVDVAGGHAPAPGEATHLVVLLGLGAAWVLSRSDPPARWRAAGAATA